MAEYLVELYVAQGDHRLARQHAEQVTHAVAELTHEGGSVHCLQSIFVPEDETCFLLYEAPAAEVVEEAVRRAGLRHQHISPAISTLHPVVDAPASPQSQRKATQ
jgi:hypothetical protein